MALVILFFVLSFLAIAGTYLNINPYDNLIWIKAIAHFMFLAFTMMIIPFCYKKFSEKATAKSGKSVCKWNCLIVLSAYFVIDIFLMGGIFDETFQNLGSNLFYALMFWYINRKLFFNDNKTMAKTIPSESEKEFIENTHDTPALDIDKMSPEEAARYLFAEQLGEEYQPIENPKNNKGTKIKYCSQCGSPIDPVTKKCTGCGKQYFRGIKLGKCPTIVVVLMFILVAVLTVIALQMNGQITDLQKQLSQKQNTINGLLNSVDELQGQIQDNEELINFVDDYVVFVEDDGTNLYHKYECYRFKGESFWVYNTEKAVQFDFSPCPKCH